MRLKDSLLALPVLAASAMPIEAEAVDMDGTLGMVVAAEKLQTRQKPGVDALRMSESARLCGVIERGDRLDWKPCMDVGIVSTGFSDQAFLHWKLLSFYGDVGPEGGLGVEWNAGYMRHSYEDNDNRYRYRALTGAAGVHYRGPEYYLAVGTQFTAGMAGRPLGGKLIDGDGSIYQTGPWWRPDFDADVDLKGVISKYPSGITGGIYFEYGGVIDSARLKKRLKNAARRAKPSSWPHSQCAH